jgi:hypothetical protein
MDFWHILTAAAPGGPSFPLFRKSAQHGEFGQLAHCERP